MPTLGDQSPLIQPLQVFDTNFLFSYRIFVHLITLRIYENLQFMNYLVHDECYCYCISDLFWCSLHSEIQYAMQFLIFDTSRCICRDIHDSGSQAP